MRFAEIPKASISMGLNLIGPVFMALSLFFGVGITRADSPGSDGPDHQSRPCLGIPIPPQSDGPMKASSQLVYPDGQGLPAGQGVASEGEAIYLKRCQRCHGTDGMGATSVELVGDHASLTRDYPVKAIGSYWLAAPTLLGFIQQAMPPQNETLSEPRLSNDESYSMVAYLLSLNGLWPLDAILAAEELALIEMPNRNGFDDSVLARQAKSHQLSSECVD